MTTTFQISKPKQKKEKSVFQPPPPSEPFLFQEARSFLSTITAYTSQSDFSGITKRMSNTNFTMLPKEPPSSLQQNHRTSPPASHQRMKQQEQPLLVVPDQIRFPTAKAANNDSSQQHNSMRTKQHQRLNELSAYALQRQSRVKSTTNKRISNTKLTKRQKEQSLRHIHRISQQPAASQKRMKQQQQQPALVVPDQISFLTSAKAANNDSSQDHMSMRNHQRLNHHLSPYALQRQSKVKSRRR
jgi:hypothetical protein